MGALDDIAEASARTLLPLDIALLDPEDRVHEAMLKGWKRQQQSRMLRAETIRSRLSIIERFHRYSNLYPWQWTPADFEAFCAYLVSTGMSFSSLRGYQGDVRLFMEYVTDPRYGWLTVCGNRFNQTPQQICDDWNTTTHTSGQPGRRPLTFDEVQQFFDHSDSRVAAIRKARRKGSLAAFRDAVTYKVIYAYGLRRREATRLDLADFRTNPAVPQFGRFGSVHVRYGKGVRGGPPRHRTVLTVPEFDWVIDVVQQYIEEVRHQFAPQKHPGLFLTERLGYVSPVYLGNRFTELAREAGLPPDLELHSLRHSYSTHLAEFGYDPLFIKEQLGHSYLSTTAIYTHVSSEFKNKQLKAALANLYGEKSK